MLINDIINGTRQNQYLPVFVDDNMVREEIVDSFSVINAVTKITFTHSIY